VTRRRLAAAGSAAGDLGLGRFLEELTALRGRDDRVFFTRGEAISIARAPGRLDVMGGIADYSGSLVLQMPTQEAAFAAVQLSSGNAVDLVSLGREGAVSRVSVRADVGQLLSYPEERQRFAETGGWSAYAIGAFPVLAHERAAGFVSGARICIGSTVPEGRGVASSAAVEVAVMAAIVDAYGLSVDMREIALLCQLLENEVVGVPCGPMDQFAIALGERSRLLALLCRPAELQEFVDLPDDVVVVGIDSGASHSNAGRAYRRARAAAFMGKHIVEREHGPLAHLTELTPSDLRRGPVRLPQSLSGAEYLRRYGPLTGAGTSVDQEERYPVRAAALHAVAEHQRVQEFADLLPRAQTYRELEYLGTLLDLAHRGYDACGLATPATDDVVTWLGEVPGVYGARVSGGGSGGTVVALARAGAVATIAEIARAHGRRLFSESSPGAQEFGIRRVVLRDR
jgi:L-arabinokinase